MSDLLKRLVSYCSIQRSKDIFHTVYPYTTAIKSPQYENIPHLTLTNYAAISKFQIFLGDINSEALNAIIALEM